VEHDPRSVDALIARIAALEPDPAEVRVVLATSYGMLVERLLDAGYVVVPGQPRPGRPAADTHYAGPPDPGTPSHTRTNVSSASADCRVSAKLRTISQQVRIRVFQLLAQPLFHVHPVIDHRVTPHGRLHVVGRPAP
jgi:hypothetical protein